MEWTPADLLRLVNRHPHVVRAVRTALAAAAAWMLVWPFGGPVDQYPYYAPLGAVVAVSGTVAGSVRTSLQGVLALMIGAGLALAVQPMVPWPVLGLSIVVGVGSLIGAWPLLGPMASWVPISAMFVLIVGRPHPQQYVTAYLGLTALGAAVGVVANLVFAPLPLSRTGAQVTKLRTTLAEQLHDLADGLRHESPLTHEEWGERHHALVPITRRMSELVGEASEARRANWRARRWKETAHEQYERARALEQLALLVEDVTGLLGSHEAAGEPHIALGPALRPPAADVLETLGELLGDVGSPLAEPERLRAVDQALARLVEGIRERREESGDDLFSAGSVVIAVRRAVASLVPDELTDELPSRH
ncbi:MAG TPA: hypothetical protein VFL69_14500 [Marmoricola sp.]|nr:hypothetical protein [Marmoricola sp.]